MSSNQKALKDKKAMQRMRMLLMFTVFLALAAYYFSKDLIKLKVSRVFSSVASLQKNIEEERKSGKAFNPADWDPDLYRTRYGNRLVISNKGVLMLQLSSSMAGLANQWVFWVPMLHLDGSKSEPLDLSESHADKTRAMYWLCGVPPKNGANFEFIPEYCHLRLDETYALPE